MSTCYLRSLNTLPICTSNADSPAIFVSNSNSGHRLIFITIYNLCVVIVSDYENSFRQCKSLALNPKPKAHLLRSKPSRENTAELAQRVIDRLCSSDIDPVVLCVRMQLLLEHDYRNKGTYNYTPTEEEFVWKLNPKKKKKKTGTKRVFTCCRQNRENLVYCSMNTGFSSYFIFPYVSASKANLTRV